jgi:ribonucleoside-diphosphate reductase alpha subunit
MEVIKRNGTKEKVSLTKITNRLQVLSEGLAADHIIVATKVVNGLYDGVPTRQLDILAAEVSAMMSTHHPDYDALAAKITVSNLHKETGENFAAKIHKLRGIGIIGETFAEYVHTHRDALNAMIDYDRDYLFDYFGVKTLIRAYLLKDKNGTIIERPQDMWMRVAAFIHQGDLVRTKETYDLMSQKYFTHATPTLFNAGTVKPQLSSCFLLDIDADSIGGIYKTLTDCAKISQSAGGIGLSIHKIRSKGSYIHGTNGVSNGIVPMLRVFDATARYVDQGGGKRKGSIAIYLEPWHADIFDFLDLKKNHGKEELRARDLFYALWIPDLFMKRVEEDGEWTLFDPAKASMLPELHGEDFEQAYITLEQSGLGENTIKARELWEHILRNQIETGVPYILYKDAANAKSNQQNLGTIKSSNLCAEIIEYTSPEEVAVCNLASISLPAFTDGKTIDYDKLYEVAKVITRNLNNVIDVNYYPVKEAATSNFRHRPIGIGVQGLADLYAKCGLGFAVEEAKRINLRIFETIYKGAIDASIELARLYGPYESSAGSPAANGQLQFDLWGLDRSNLWLDWSATFDALHKHGLRNSLLLAPMPTASTSQILGNNEAFEPFTSNLYTRRTLAGEFIVVNRWLLKDLIELGLWNDTLRNKLISSNGSVQYIPEIPEEIRERYRTVWEMSMKDIIDMAADRGKFICQSQSLNLFIANPTLPKLTSMHFYAWRKGLKTGMYYLRSEAAAHAIQFTVKKEVVLENEDEEEEEKGQTCSIDNPDCESCSG